MKYAVMVCLDGKDDWIYLTENTGHCDMNLSPRLFNTSELAEEVAEIWRMKDQERNVKVVTYESED